MIKNGARLPSQVCGSQVIVLKAGQGTLSVGTTPLVIKEAKPVPASD